MISLFDENAKYTEDATFLDAAVQKLIEPIMRKYANKGFSVRDIYTIVQMTAMDIMTEIILDNDMKDNKQRIRSFSK